MSTRSCFVVVLALVLIAPSILLADTATVCFFDKDGRLITSTTTSYTSYTSTGDPETSSSETPDDPQTSSSETTVTFGENGQIVSIVTSALYKNPLPKTSCEPDDTDTGCPDDIECDIECIVIPPGDGEGCTTTVSCSMHDDGSSTVDITVDTSSSDCSAGPDVNYDPNSADNFGEDNSTETNANESYNQPEENLFSDSTFDPVPTGGYDLTDSYDPTGGYDLTDYYDPTMDGCSEEFC